MKIEIVVFENEQTDEDGTVNRTWIATSATHSVSAAGGSPKVAVRNFMRWLKLACDADVRNVPPLDFVVTPQAFMMPEDIEPGSAPPAGVVIGPIEPNGPPHATELHEWIAAWHEAARIGDFDSFKGDDHVIRPPSFPLYASASDEARSMFAVGIPFGEVVVPDGWDVRIFRKD